MSRSREQIQKVRDHWERLVGVAMANRLFREGGLRLMAAAYTEAVEEERLGHTSPDPDQLWADFEVGLREGGDKL